MKKKKRIDRNRRQYLSSVTILVLLIVIVYGVSKHLQTQQVHQLQSLLDRNIEVIFTISDSSLISKTGFDVRFNEGCIIGKSYLRYESELPFEKILDEYKTELLNRGWEQSQSNYTLTSNNIEISILNYSSTNNEPTHKVFLTVFNDPVCVF